MNRHFDFIIVGQGLAGSMLYWALVRKGKGVFVIDKFNPSSSSNIAAGIIHPITGRRIVKTWMADALIPFAEKTYSEIEKHFNEQLFFSKNILELIHSAKDQNDWEIKRTSPEMKNYFSNEKTSDLYNDVLIDNPKKISIVKSGWLDIQRLTKMFREELISKESILNEDFDYTSLKSTSAGISYKNFTADYIIFCEGHHAIENPYWKHLPFMPAKGEILTIRSNALKLQHIITKTIFILPIGNNLFKVGSTYSWNERDEIPTAKAKENLLNQLDKIIKVPYEVIDHKAAVRPTVKDRRPFIGFHKDHPRIGIFNGLGTKGVLLAPFFSHHFTQHILEKTNLMEEVDIKKFEVTGLSES